MTHAIKSTRVVPALLIGAIALLIAVLIAVSGPIQPAEAATKNVAAGVNSGSNHLNVFSPKFIRVKRGTKVQWTFSGTEHNVFSLKGWSSPVKTTGTWSKTFKRKGSFAYYCTLHGGMTGKVTVY